ncbi:MAG: nucleoside 2-deoxyribosyltransferase [Methanocorpusculum sp.]|nr:nucleoside 2-deoxyribosyltransferase [Methanocorpusculum sp.]
MSYILASPCILNPNLRAEGITSAEDLAIFSRCIERCREAGIEIVPLPCPETLFFGEGRAPGSFKDRMDVPEFHALLDRLEENVRDVIAERGGAPLFILGVNSSPTCGVTKTYYTNEKSDGAGVFLKRFSEYSLVDVKEFAKYRIYFAAPLFSEGERSFNRRAADILEELYFHVHLPQELDDDEEARGENREAAIYAGNLAALKEADIVVGVIDGADADSGTAWEMGYATASGKRVIALRTDFRRLSENESVNLMLEMDADVVHSLYELRELLTYY